MNAAQQIYTEAQATLSRCASAYGEAAVRKASPQSFATVAEIQTWLNMIADVRASFGMSSAQLDWSKFPYGTDRATVEQYARAKRNRVYRTGDELPAYSERVDTAISALGNKYEVRRINKRHYISKNGFCMGMNPSHNPDHTMRRYLGWCWDESNAITEMRECVWQDNDEFRRDQA